MNHSNIQGGKKHLIKWAFIFAACNFAAVDLFVAGTLIGKYGDNQLVVLTITLGLIAIFFLGYFAGKYHADNPL